MGNEKLQQKKSQQEKSQHAIIKTSKTISPVWLIPFVAVLIGIWMIYENISNQGVLIHIEFDTAQGLEKKKTLVKFKNVVIGKVQDIELDSDLTKVMVSCRIENKHADLLRKESKFWVVRPRIGSQGISGLDTLVSGAYIEFSPSNNKEDEDEFIGLELPPVTPAGTPGLHITLDNKGDKTLDLGDTILFRGIRVGKIEHVFFNATQRTVYYNAFIKAPYDKLITTNTQFWQVNGIEFELSADGIRVETGTLDTILQGGVSFDIPQGMPIGEPVLERAYFSINPNKGSINQKNYNHTIEYVLLFDESIRGLKPNAPVEFRGLKIGRVKRTDIDYPNMGNILNKTVRVPVLISIYPAKVGLADTPDAKINLAKNIDGWIKQGLQAQIATGNLLTGSKIIELHYTKRKNVVLQKFNDYRVMPVTSGGLTHIIEKTTKMVDKISQLPFKTLANNANTTILELTATLKVLKKAAVQLEKILATPETQQLSKDTHQVLSTINQVAENFAQGGAGEQALQQSLVALKKVLDQLQPLLIQLNQRPNSLIFSDQKSEDIEPKGAQ